MVLEEVVAAGLDQDIELTTWGPTVAHGAVEGVSESCREEDEKGRRSGEN